MALTLTDASDAVGAPVSLGPAHLGVALAAPPAPALGEADELRYAWRRCAFYTTLVSADGASHLWRLDDGSTSTAAADVLGSAPGSYVGAHASAASAPLDEQGGTGAAFDGTGIRRDVLRCAPTRPVPTPTRWSCGHAPNGWTACTAS